MTDKFICPVCGYTLLRENNSLKCGKGHCFDISSSGYVNLLTKGGKKGHGDDKKMVKAKGVSLRDLIPWKNIGIVWSDPAMPIFSVLGAVRLLR